MWLRGAAGAAGGGGADGEVSGDNRPNISIFLLHFSSPEFTKSSNKFYPTNQPRESLSQHNPLYAFLSACGILCGCRVLLVLVVK